jgi:phenylacetate-coenzyme A ligase PaaK-like adenylate-forming protein
VSVDRSEVVKTMTSSGTTGQAVSKIYLDRTTAANQQRTLSRIVSDFIGTPRMPMLIIDSPSVVKNRAMFSARGAGILGFSIFGSERAYALDDEMNLDDAGLGSFLAKHQGRSILLFGFTFMVWQHFYKKLAKLRIDTGRTFDLSRGKLIHGGGWKKVTNEAVSPAVFKTSLQEVCGLAQVHEYYGLVEQTGCIYMECEHGRLHASVFSDVITRHSADFAACVHGEKGIIQVLSVLPKSYPGHSLLTEDEGTIWGEDDCPCGRKGKYFTVSGRLKHAEIRGCSDTYAATF